MLALPDLLQAALKFGFGLLHDLLHGFAQMPFDGLTVDFGERVVDQNEAPIAVEEGKTDRRQIEQGIEERQRFLLPARQSARLRIEARMLQRLRATVGQRLQKQPRFFVENAPFAPGKRHDAHDAALGFER